MADEDQEAPLRWGTLDFQPILAGLKPLEEITSLLTQFTDLLSTIMDAIILVIEAAKLLMTGFTDILQVAYQAIVDLAQATVQQLTQTGIYNIIHYTPSISQYMTPEEWCSAVASSFNDKMDAERPILIDPSAFVCAVALTTTSDNLKDLMGKWNKLGAMLGAFVRMLFSQISGWGNPGDPFAVTPGVGQVPNWKSVKLPDILPGMNQAADYLMGLLDSLKPSDQNSSLMDAFIKSLQDKIKVVTAYGQKVLAILGLINAILSIEGVYSLVISGQGDAAWVGQQLRSATGGPHDYGKYDENGKLLPEDKQKEATFTFGTMFLITGGSTAAIDILSSFFEGVVLPLPNPEIPQIPDYP